MLKRLWPSCLLLLTSFLLAGPARAADGDCRLPPGIGLGSLTGPGSEQLSRLLARRTGGGAGGGLLSGQISLVSRAHGEREAVPLEVKEGRPYPVYRPDPFTGRLWLTEERAGTVDLQSYDLERFTGALVFDWRLLAPGGELLKSGRIALDIDRTRGGYLAEKGLTAPLGSEKQGRRAFKTRLADELVHQLTLDLGRFAPARELENGGHALDRQARRLAMAGDWDGARDLWLELLELNPKYAPALFNLGLYSERQRRPEDAWRYYRAAFLSVGSPKHREALSRLTEALGLAGRLPEAKDAGKLNP
ncbi:MAG: hypothetical protein LBP33_04080 [Candidatus Adiutrix sp.]|jgi:tetratricopeptide (TPR) repeat protein|nr:hypothetical protein [Candidatus Adiutrix sp.]